MADRARFTLSTLCAFCRRVVSFHRARAHFSADARRAKTTPPTILLCYLFYNQFSASFAKNGRRLSSSRAPLYALVYTRKTSSLLGMRVSKGCYQSEGCEKKKNSLFLYPRATTRVCNVVTLYICSLYVQLYIAIFIYFTPPLTCNIEQLIENSICGVYSRVEAVVAFVNRRRHYYVAVEFLA